MPDVPATSPQAVQPRYPLLLVDVPAEEADEASALLFDLGADGIEERDQTTLSHGDRGDRVTLVASFADDAAVTAAVAELPPAWSPRAGEIVGDAWRDAYKKHFRPFRLTENVVIFPPWERAERERPGDILIELEPGRAFGTGLHATTRGVSLALEEHRDEITGARVLDVGTGSGILLLVAAGLGAASGLGIDIDPDAVTCARENSVRNEMQDRLAFEAIPVDRIEETFPVVLANIEARTLAALASELIERMRPAGMLVLAGVLAEQKDVVRAAFAALELEAAHPDGEWVALVLRKRAI